MVHLSAGTVINQTADNQRVNYSRLLMEKEDPRLAETQNYTLLNPTTDNFSKALLKSFAIA